ncbi:MAG: class I SAM-dependent DNA methyltransferase [Isosphaeraceae bacterium]
MQTDELLETLGYGGSSNFIQGGDLEDAPGYSHIFRRARGEDSCRLVGVYTLRERTKSGKDEGVPLVYVCDAESREHADLIHRRVWNQNVVPFLVVRTPQIVRLYSGFRYDQGDGQDTASPDAGVLDALIEFNEVAAKLRAFHAESVDDGTLWREWGAKVTPGTRVDWKLLGNLEALDGSLQEDGLTRITSHALIGKYVYLRYLRDRGILSDRKFAEWGIDPESIFSRNASKDALKDLLERISGWLNGSVFPLPLEGNGAPEPYHVRRVAGNFQGDDPSGQLHLNFESYDFSYIPIETISVIYEQFLHSTGRGREAGAYYTPIPLVNYMLEELNDRRRLQVGMKVFDPACGSGAFLVQCYRWLVECELAKAPNHHLPPVRLRSLLEEHIFGMDDDEDACRVAQLSLTLTLLDYIDPPDLQENPDFRIPKVLDSNIFKGNFFRFPSAWLGAMDGVKFDWIVGNPPWKDISKDHLEEREEPALQWIVEHRGACPTGGNQLAEAFAWKVAELAAERGVIGLVLPAMTLFKDESRHFRKMFLRRLDVWCVVNFANLAEVLFAGRARKPAAVFFYSPWTGGEERSPESSILTFAPLVANQEANRPVTSRAREETWSIVVNASEIREIPLSRAASGDRLPWKIAMWGSARDQRLIDYLHKEYPSLSDVANVRGLHVHPGLELRNKDSAEPVEHVAELEGKKVLVVERLRGRGRLFAFPAEAFDLIDKDQSYVRRSRAEVPLKVCRPPHIVLDAARRYAVFSDEFIAVPPRQIGIAGEKSQAPFLKALSLFLSSKLVTYHQFLHSPQWGVQGGRATLQTLKQLPIPLDGLVERELSRWLELYDALVEAWPTDRKKRFDPTLSLFDDGDQDLSKESEIGDTEADALYVRLNELVYECVGIDKNERYLIDDLVDVKMQLIDGKVSKDALRGPTKSEIEAYAAVLQGELDDFLGEVNGLRHLCTVVHDQVSGMVQIELVEATSTKLKPTVFPANALTAQEFAKAREELRREYGQWLYFDRNLRVYRGNRTFVLKPFQRLHWLCSQALIDADEIIAETIAATGD